MARELKSFLVEGRAASGGETEGIAYVISSESPVEDFPDGYILVCEMANPTMTIQMRKAMAIITNRGGISSHAAIIAREKRIPCIVGTTDATQKIPHNALIFVEVEKQSIGAVGRVFLAQR